MQTEATLFVWDLCGIVTSLLGEGCFSSNEPHLELFESPDLFNARWLQSSKLVTWPLPRQDRRYRISDEPLPELNWEDRQDFWGIETQTETQMYLCTLGSNTPTPPQAGKHFHDNLCSKSAMPCCFIAADRDSWLNKTATPHAPQSAQHCHLLLSELGTRASISMIIVATMVISKSAMPCCCCCLMLIGTFESCLNQWVWQCLPQCIRSVNYFLLYWLVCSMFFNWKLGAQLWWSCDDKHIISWIFNLWATQLELKGLLLQQCSNWRAILLQSLGV